MGDPNADELGDVHMLMFGDFKQLPPATSQAPFVVLDLVRNFDFRCLHENRRVVNDPAKREKTEVFHQVLADISYGRCTDVVRKFIIDSYVRGAKACCADRCRPEGSTAVFTKRRYRNEWNRAMTKQIAKEANHSIKIRGMVRARGQRGNNWYSEKRVAYIRSKTRTQNLWQLHLAGDWHENFETEAPKTNPHMARAMMTANLATSSRFANGTQGRVMFWNPACAAEKKKALPASFHELRVRFVKETSLKKSELFPDVDQMDVSARQENLPLRGEPILLQIPLVPAYALTIHKTYAWPPEAMTVFQLSCFDWACLIAICCGTRLA